MAVKTITEGAYFALKNLKGVNESFSDTILRVSKKRSLSEFVGILSEASGARLEAHVVEMRKKHLKSRQERMNRIVARMRGADGGF